MIDFQEFLSRAILAARAGKTAEARRNLDTALKMQPRNPRAWLWVAAVAESSAEQRLCLERALVLDPSLLAAQILLERLKSTTHAPPSAAVKVLAFQCQQCGGQQRFDPDLGGLVCVHCGNTEALTTVNAAENEQGLEEKLAQSSAGNWSLLAGQITCDKCGAVTLSPAQESTHICPFCGSSQALLQPPTPGLISPQAIAPFAFDAEAATQHVQRWLSSGMFSPRDLKQLAYTRELHGLYLPFWTFDGQVQIRCRVNYPLKPESFNYKERIAAHGTWPREKLWYEQDIDDLLIYAGHSVPAATLEDLLPFEPKSVVEYQPAFLADWQAEVYQIALTDAAQVAYKRMRDRAMRSAAGHGVIPDYSVFLENDSRIIERTFKLILLPVWSGSYLYRDQSYEVWLNGQTGKISGEKPMVGAKLWRPRRQRSAK